MEEREEIPECLLINPYKIIDIAYYNYSNQDYQNTPDPNALFVSEKIEKETRKDEEVVITELNYILLEKFPQYTNQQQVYLRSADILTLVDPGHLMLEYYKKIVG